MQKLPLAQLGCDGIAPAALADVAAQADEVMAVAQTAGLGTAIMELDDHACASWIEDNVLFVLLCDGDLAFNRLLARMAATTTTT